MTSILTSAAQTAHSAAATLLSKAQIQPGGNIGQYSVKESAPDKTVEFKLTGKNIIVGVPGAFSGTCNAQVPEYIESYDRFKAKGINDIYVVAVNDAFVMQAWKDKLAPSGTGVRFIADDKGLLTSGLGLVFDASPVFGAPRSKRYAIIATGDQVDTIAVEEDPTKVTATGAKTILAQL